MKKFLLILTGVLLLVVFYSKGDIVSAYKELSESIKRYREIAALLNASADTELWMPVDGVRASKVVDTWGAPRSGGRTHQGQDIFAPKGTPIRSATDGFILFRGQNELGGNVVYVLGAGGVRYYYAHLDSFASGIDKLVKVDRNTIIGYVGNTGNAETTPPHLHFGVYTKGGAVNPISLLRDR